jgi:hypothetical protein
MWEELHGPARTAIIGRAGRPVFGAFVRSVINWFNNLGIEFAVSNALDQLKGFAFDVEDRATTSADADGVSLDGVGLACLRRFWK